MSGGIGIDLGSRMIKVAEFHNGQDAPELISLSGVEPFLPNCLSLAGNGNLGWEALGQRHVAPGTTVDDFRDTVLSLRSQLPFGDQSISTIEVQKFALELLGAKISHHFPKSPICVMSVPDVWPDGGWSLAAGLGVSAWKPYTTIRESAAVWRTQSHAESSAAFLISAGFSGLTASRMLLHSERWKVTGKQRSVDLSGRLLREKLIEQLANQVIEAIRRDPREDNVADQGLHDGLERALIQLCSAETSSAQVQLFDRPVPINLTKQSLGNIIPNAKTTWQDFCSDLVHKHDGSVENLPFYIWGELSLLLPLKEWAQEVVPREVVIHQLPLDVVAAGAALVAADLAERGLAGFDDGLGEIGSADGRWQPTLVDQVTPGMVPLISSLPLVGEQPPLGVPMTLALIENGRPASSQVFAQQRVSMGRSPDCSLVVNDEAYPMVSGSHAVIYQSPEGFVLEDEGSTNGTFANSEQVQGRIRIDSGTEIRLGQRGPTIRFSVTD